VHDAPDKVTAAGLGAGWGLLDDISHIGPATASEEDGAPGPEDHEEDAGGVEEDGREAHGVS